MTKNDKHDQEMNQDLGKWVWRKNRSIQTVLDAVEPCDFEGYVCSKLLLDHRV